MCSFRFRGATDWHGTIKESWLRPCCGIGCSKGRYISNGAPDPQTHNLSSFWRLPSFRACSRMLYALMFLRVPEGPEQRPLHNTGILWGSRHFNDQALSLMAKPGGRRGVGRCLLRNRVGGEELPALPTRLAGRRAPALRRARRPPGPGTAPGSRPHARRSRCGSDQENAPGRCARTPRASQGTGRMILKSAPRLRSVLNQQCLLSDFQQDA